MSPYIVPGYFQTQRDAETVSRGKRSRLRRKMLNQRGGMLSWLCLWDVEMALPSTQSAAWSRCLTGPGVAAAEPPLDVVTMCRSYDDIMYSLLPDLQRHFCLRKGVWADVRISHQRDEGEIASHAGFSKEAKKEAPCFVRCPGLLLLHFFYCYPKPEFILFHFW